MLPSISFAKCSMREKIYIFYFDFGTETYDAMHVLWTNSMYLLLNIRKWLCRVRLERCKMKILPIKRCDYSSLREHFHAFSVQETELTRFNAIYFHSNIPELEWHFVSLFFAVIYLCMWNILSKYAFRGYHETLKKHIMSSHWILERLIDSNKIIFRAHKINIQQMWINDNL